MPSSANWEIKESSREDSAAIKDWRSEAEGEVMFTILHQPAGDNRERIFEAAEVEYVGRRAESGPYGVHYKRPGDQEYIGLISDGRVFIMNQFGATVAKYVLSASLASEMRDAA